MMRHVFPYIFYTFSQWSQIGFKSMFSHMDAHAMVSAIQLFNLATAFIYFVGKPSNKYIWLVIVVLIYIINLFFFNAKSLEKFNERWKNESKGKRLVKRSLVLLYVLTSFVALFYTVWVVR